MSRTSAGSPRLISAFALAAAAAFALTGCGSGGSGGSSGAAVTKADLQDATFTASKVTGHDLVKDSTLTLTFEGESLAVKAGCNTMTGAWSADGGILKWTGEPAMTMMACDDPLMQQDTWLNGLLTKGMDGKISGDALTLTSSDVTIELSK